MSWSDVQRRLAALGYYTGPLDNDPGDGTQAGVIKLLEIAEKAQGVKPAKPVEVQAVVAGNFTLPAGFPTGYKWIGKVGTLPRLLQEALPLYGIKETAGAGDSATIMSWAKEAGLEAVYIHDSIAWCGLFAALVVKRSGYDPVAGPLWALNWLKFGIAATKPALGDILCFVRDGGGHVGFYVGEDDSYYHVLGGNTSDAVTIARIAKSRLKGARRPAYKNPLPGWRKYQVAATGAISKNEA